MNGPTSSPERDRVATTTTPAIPGSLLGSLSLRHLILLAGAFVALCAALAFTRPDGGWEWVPAIAGFAFFATLAGRRVTRVPYHNTVPALALAVVIPGCHVIAAFNRARPANMPELAIDRAIQVEPDWMLVYGSVFFFAFTADGFLPWTLGLIYDIDPPRNCFPSLHVAWAFVAGLSCHRVHRGVGLAAIGWASLIGISTLYTEQHYFADVIAGVLLASLA